MLSNSVPENMNSHKPHCLIKYSIVTFTNRAPQIHTILDTTNPCQVIVQNKARPVPIRRNSNKGRSFMQSIVM